MMRHSVQQSGGSHDIDLAEESADSSDVMFEALVPWSTSASPPPTYADLMSTLSPSVMSSEASFADSPTYAVLNTPSPSVMSSEASFSEFRSALRKKRAISDVTSDVDERQVIVSDSKPEFEELVSEPKEVVSEEVAPVFTGFMRAELLTRQNNPPPISTASVPVISGFSREEVLALQNNSAPVDLGVSGNIMKRRRMQNAAPTLGSISDQSVSSKKVPFYRFNKDGLPRVFRKWTPGPVGSPVTLRTMYFERELKLRISDVSENAEKRVFFSPESVLGANASPPDSRMAEFGGLARKSVVFLNGEEFRAFQAVYFDIIDALNAGRPAEFVLNTSDSIAGKTIAKTVSVVNRIVLIRSWIHAEGLGYDGEPVKATKWVDGKVCLTDKEYAGLEEILSGEADKVFYLFPHTLQNNNVSKIVLEECSKTLLEMLKGEIPDLKATDFENFPRIFSDAFFRVYCEFLNASYVSGNGGVLARVSSELCKQGLSEVYDHYSFFQQIMNNIPLVLAEMKNFSFSFLLSERTLHPKIEATQVVAVLPSQAKACIQILKLFTCPELKIRINLDTSFLHACKI